MPPGARQALPAAGTGETEARSSAPSAAVYQDSLPWQALVQLRLVAFQPVLETSSLIPLLWVADFTVVEL
jgi:hypothetical protein